MAKEKKGIPKKNHDISNWYLNVICKADLISYGPVKGTIVFKPYGYAIWENIQTVLDNLFKSNGIQNAYFPLLIPYSLIAKEKQHIKGFNPELALVTKVAKDDLKEPYVLRPTSETIMYTMFSEWIQSYKDLPLKLNQWTNIIRWEKRTYPFLRTSEFLWQEGHTVHEIEKEASEMALKALHWYQRFYEEVLAISPYVGEKSISERFAGAMKTFSVEIVIPDGKALQAATSHELGQNFAKTFNIKYLDKNNKLQFPYQTSWGLSTRSIGSLILSHGDDNGLILPPRIAPYQVVLFFIPTKSSDMNKRIEAFIQTIEDSLIKSSIRYIVDRNYDKSLGYRMSEIEIKGIPIRIEIGTAEYEKKLLTISRRDNMIKEKIPMRLLGQSINDLMDEMHQALLERSIKLKKDMTINITSWEDFEKTMKSNRSFIRAFWCEERKCEAAIKDKTKATTRIVEFDQLNNTQKGKCIYCGNPALHKWLFAQAY